MIKKAYLGVYFAHLGVLVAPFYNLIAWQLKRRFMVLFRFVRGLPGYMTAARCLGMNTGIKPPLFTGVVFFLICRGSIAQQATATRSGLFSRVKPTEIATSIYIQSETCFSENSHQIWSKIRNFSFWFIAPKMEGRGVSKNSAILAAKNFY